MRSFRKLVRGWAANEVASMNKEKASLAEAYNNLDKLSEARPLTESERERMDSASRKSGKNLGFRGDQDKTEIKG